MLRKIWHEDEMEVLSSFCNLRDNYKKVIPEVLHFTQANSNLFDEWVMDKWVDDTNLGRVQLWDGAWRVIPFPINAVGSTADENDFELSEMVTFTELFNTTTERVQELLPRITQSFVRFCSKNLTIKEKNQC